MLHLHYKCFIFITNASSSLQMLHLHYNSNRELYSRFEEIVQRIVPDIETIETPIKSGSNTTVSIRFKGDSSKYNLWQISSGLKYILNLISVIHFSSPGSFLIVEEPENHLHPASQRILASIIQDVSEEQSKQFLVTTHSGIIMDYFEPKNIYLMDKIQSETKAIRLRDSDVYLAWERLGIESTALLQILRRSEQAIVIVEGRDDLKALQPLWDHFRLTDKVLVLPSHGSGWKEIIESSNALRKSLIRFGLKVPVFVLLDNDGERDEKKSYFQKLKTDERYYHIWTEKELESYLILPSAFGKISGESVEDVMNAIEKTNGKGKELLASVLKELGIEGTPYAVIIKNALINGPDEISLELMGLEKKIRDILD